MGRAEVGTPKYLANKMKAKGLQKLRWFCQMCQKQCRDENGFKCHTMSESHQRQLLLFADNSKRYIDDFSREFAKGYVEILRRQFGTKRVAANKVYQEYISDKNHLHMNATKWLSLTGFVLWLGKTGQCVVDETEKGWYITYIDRDPETVARQEKMAKKQKMDKDDEERLQEFIEKQVERGKKDSPGHSSAAEDRVQEFVRESEDEKIKLNINLATKKKSEAVFKKPSSDFLSKRPSSSSGSDNGKKQKKDIADGRRVSALDEIIKIEESKKERSNRKDYWLAEGIVVKIVSQSLSEGKYYKQKAHVTKIIDKYEAKVKLLESEKKIVVHQDQVETVIPNIGKEILILNGAYRGHRAILKSLQEDDYCVTVEIAEGPLAGRQISKIQYEDISKLY
ncbi:DNA/RNA-binding protein KIN17 [Phlebotomus papatasi]|uniref:DNA/RNA-binding protein KIN17 n=1 Tax=Phlebotomus papatasi TaxID=29031 RepID=UPI0024843D15|nr:DNA/RNA-binding protein KIN17 [Phlebotomus papatasi]